MSTGKGGTHGPANGQFLPPKTSIFGSIWATASSACLLKPGGFWLTLFLDRLTNVVAVGWLDLILNTHFLACIQFVYLSLSAHIWLVKHFHQVLRLPKPIFTHCWPWMACPVALSSCSGVRYSCNSARIREEISQPLDMSEHHVWIDPSPSQLNFFGKPTKMGMWKNNHGRWKKWPIWGCKSGGISREAQSSLGVIFIGKMCEVHRKWSQEPTTPMFARHCVLLWFPGASVISSCWRAWNYHVTCYMIIC